MINQQVNTPVPVGETEATQQTRGQQEENYVTSNLTHQADTNRKSVINNLFPWFNGRDSGRSSKLSRLDIRAALCLSISVLPVCVFTLPVTLNGIAIYWCIRLEKDCSVIFQIDPYFHNLFLIHSVYNPIMYMCSSNEFRRALSRFLRKLKLDFV